MFKVRSNVTASVLNMLNKDTSFVEVLVFLFSNQRSRGAFRSHSNIKVGAFCGDMVNPPINVLPFLNASLQ